MSTYEMYLQCLSYQNVGNCEVYTINGTRIRGKLALMDNFNLMIGNTILPLRCISHINTAR